MTLAISEINTVFVTITLVDIRRNCHYVIKFLAGQLTLICIILTHTHAQTCLAVIVEPVPATGVTTVLM